jgi:hypothetical protein
MFIFIYIYCVVIIKIFVFAHLLPLCNKRKEKPSTPTHKFCQCKGTFMVYVYCSDVNVVTGN